MNNDHRAPLAIIACVGFYLAYTYYMQVKYPEQNIPASRVEQSVGDDNTLSSSDTSQTIKGTSDVAKTEPELKPEKLSRQELIMENEKVRFEFDQFRGGLLSVQLKEFRQKKDSEQPVELVDQLFFVQPKLVNDATKIEPTTDFFAQRSESTLKMWRFDQGWEVSQSFKIVDDYLLELTLEFINKTSKPKQLVSGLVVGDSLTWKEGGSFFLAGMPTDKPKVVYSVGGSADRIDVAKYCEEPEDHSKAKEKFDYVGLERHYFLKVFLPESQQLDMNVGQFGVGMKNGCKIAFQLSQDQGLVSPDQKVELKFKGYFGAKTQNLLSNADKRLVDAVDFGFFSILAHPLLTGINFIYGFIDNYGLAIIIMTIILKILFLPLVIQQQKSAIKMKKLQPQMTKLREKYKDDNQKQQMELLKFMRENKVNPMKGCLPILPQIPVFMAYYWMLMNAIELRHAPFFGWIQDLSAQDPYWITPVLMGIGMFFQQKLTPMAGMDKTQEKVMMAMPVIFSLFMLTLPAGMVIYMLTNTIVSIIQQQWLNRRLA